MMIFYLLSGICLLFLGAEWLIRGGAALAIRLGLPLLVIGLVIVGFGTSTPELVVSTQASIMGNGDISIGNVLGSNIFNTGFILGFAAMVSPIPISKRLLNADIPIMVITAFFFFAVFLIFGSYGRLVGGVSLCGLICYIIWSVYHGRNSYNPSSEGSSYMLRHWILEALLIIFGLLCLFAGGTLFLKGAVDLVRYYGISDRVIGLTVVAVGTSLPELATSILAAFRKHGDIAIGNIIGSNIFNMLGIIGASALIAPINVSKALWIDFGYMLILFAALWAILKNDLYLKRWHGLVIFCSYLAYMSYLFY